MSNLATWFTPDLKVMSRTKGDSAVAASAYRACINLTDERTGITHPYKNKWGHVSTECIGFTDMKTLWNNAERAENRKNSTVCRELMVPMPHDWTDEQRKLCARQFGEMLRARYGVAVQVSIHRQANGSNDHCHILFTTREVDDAGVFGKKTRILDEGLKNGEISNLREEVCTIMNDNAKANGSTWFAYAGKFVDIDPDHIPTVHIPHNAHPEHRAELQAHNAAVLVGRENLKRISEDSKQTQQIIEKETQRTLENAMQKNKPLPMAKAPNPVAPGVPGQTPAPVVKVSALEAAYTLQDAANEYFNARVQHRKNTESKEAWERRLKNIQAEVPSLWERVQEAGAKFTKRITMALFNEDEGVRFNEREQRKAKAKEAIAKCDRVNTILKAIIDDPIKQAQHAEYNANPVHRQVIQAAMAESPDARRKTTPDKPEQAKAYQPSSIELETTLAPP